MITGSGPSDRLRQGRGYQIVSIICGMILLVAAILKFAQFAQSPHEADGLANFWWQRLLVIEFEVLLGSLLLSRAYRRQVRWAAAAAFVVFAIASGHHAIQGRVSCGCFGNVQVQPWVTLVLDVAAAGALASFSPGNIERAPTMPKRLAVALTAATALIAVVGIYLGGGTQLVQVDPKELDLGTVERGGEVHGVVVIMNNTSTKITIVRISASCPCASFLVNQPYVEPGRSSTVAVKLNMIHEPNFTGSLRINVSIYTDNGLVKMTAISTVVNSN